MLRVTGKPEVAVAVAVYVAPPTRALLGGLEVNEMVWLPSWTAPASQLAPDMPGMPRWSALTGQNPVLGLGMSKMAGFPISRASVSVGPPLFCRGPNRLARFEPAESLSEGPDRVAGGVGTHVVPLVHPGAEGALMARGREDIRLYLSSAGARVVGIGDGPPVVAGRVGGQCRGLQVEAGGGGAAVCRRCRRRPHRRRRCWRRRWSSDSDASTDPWSPLSMAPPSVVAVLVEKVESRPETIEPLALKMAPPLVALFPEKVELVKKKSPPFALTTPPPFEPLPS